MGERSKSPAGFTSPTLGGQPAAFRSREFFGHSFLDRPASAGEHFPGDKAVNALQRLPVDGNRNLYTAHEILPGMTIWDTDWMDEEICQRG